MKTYKESDLKEMYRLSNKYWKTGDTDFLPVRNKIASSIDDRYWSEITNIMNITVRKHLPLQTAADALALFGYKCIDSENEFEKEATT